MRVYLTGADGMLGTAITAYLATVPGLRVHGVSIADHDIADERAVARSIAGFRPDVVLHTAALAIVDTCERDPKLALRVNVAGARNVATACRDVGARLISISSDYVFDGGTNGPGPGPSGYREDDVPGPVSVYGLTKLAGERITATVPDHLSIRTAWLYGGRDPRVDVVLATVNALTEGRDAPLIADQFSNPTHVNDLAAALVRLLPPGNPAHQGVLHVANRGRASWYEVGQAIAAHLGPAAHGRPVPVRMKEAGFVGDRPIDSHLDGGRLTALGITMPSWSDALARHCAALDPVAVGG